MKGATKIIRLAFIATFVALVVSSSGCDAIGLNWWQWFSPDKPIRTPARTPVMPIFDEYSPIDQVDELVPNSTFPNDQDLTFSDTDYVMGPTDMVDITIMNLYNLGVEAPVRQQISDSGFIRLPELPEQIFASGLTKEQLRDSIIEQYVENGLLNDPTISVAIVARRQSTFSVLGAVAAQGPYMVIRKDMRLTEALAHAGGVTNPSLPFIYVIRHAPAKRAKRDSASSWSGDGEVALPELPELPTLPEVPELPADIPEPHDDLPQLPLPEEPQQSQPLEMPELPAIPAQPETPGTNGADSAVDDINKSLRELEQLIPDNGPSTSPGDAADTKEAPAQDMLPEPSTMPSPSEAGGRFATTSTSQSDDSQEDTEWIFKDGAWIMAPKTVTQPAKEQLAAPSPFVLPKPKAKQAKKSTDADDPFGWKDAQKTEGSRIIAIDYARLKRGDPTMDIVIRDKDIIRVPALEFAEFYMYGEVREPGAYSLTGRKITVKMALAAAGNLSFLAYPKNSVLIRRVGKNEEQIIPLDINAIFKGEQPDYFLKPNDVIAVGTNAMIPILATIRNAFRLTYGFGFIYDRNFANPAVGSSGLDGRRFSRW